MRPRSIFACLAVMLATSVPALAQCPPMGPGTFIVNPFVTGTWSSAGSPYVVTVPVTVLNLTILPGTIVHAMAGTSITIGAGILNAQGCEGDPIEFGMAAAPAPGAPRWQGIVFQGPVPNPANHVLRHCIIKHAGNSGIRIQNDTPTIDRCVLRDNITATTGGGIDIASSTGALAITDTDVILNSSASHGGGINAVLSGGASLTLDGCTVSDNKANPTNANTGQHVGGGIRVAGQASLINCRVERNELRARADSNGGAMASHGGGIFADGGPFSIERCIIGSNYSYATNATSFPIAIARGGGVFANGPSFSAVNCLIVCNVVAFGSGGQVPEGAGLQISSPSASITNCTIAHNSHIGLWNGNATAVQVDSTIAWGNNPPPPGASGAQTFGTVTASHSNIQMPGGSTFAGTLNINQLPSFVGGTPCAPSFFAISPFSPSVNTGNPSATMNDASWPGPPSIPLFSPSNPVLFYGGTSMNDIGVQGGPANHLFTSPVHVVGGVNVYSRDVGGANGISLAWDPASPTSTLGAFSVTSCLPGVAAFGNSGLLALSTAPANLFNATYCATVLVDLAAPGAAIYPYTFGTTLNADLSQPALLGFRVFVQVADVTPPFIHVSNGAEVVFFY